MPEGAHTKYSVNKKQVFECMERTPLSNIATLYTQQLHPYNGGKSYTCRNDWSEFSDCTFNLLIYKQAMLPKCFPSEFFI